MFIHLGSEKIIRAAELIAIFDISIDKPAKISREFIHFANENKQIEIIGEEEPKSLVITDHKIFYSPISSATLKKRANQMLEL